MPLWRDAALISDDAPRTGRDADDALRFARGLTGRLDLEPDHLMPAYEDPRGRELGDDGLLRFGPPCGFVLPLRPRQGREQRAGHPEWRSERWPLERLVLIPGDSPLGYRLPLGSLPAPPATAD